MTIRRPLDRREFLTATSGAGALALAAAGGLAWPSAARADDTNLQSMKLGFVGVGGHGETNIALLGEQQVAALCDVDENYLEKMSQRHPQAATFRDWREMLAAGGLEGLVISTPDHTHGVIAAAAMRQGLPIYLEKPVSNRLSECRLLAEIAQETGVVTQIGTQHHAKSGSQRVAQIVKSGVLGDIREVHAWSNRPIWPQGMPLPAEAMPVPPTLDWDLWLGPCEERPYSNEYLPFKWRGWRDFGSGALGDMGPHLLSSTVAALELAGPISATCERGEVTDVSYPTWSIVTLEFAERGELPPVSLTWYDGGKLPPRELAGVGRYPENGTLLIGEHGQLFVPSYGGAPLLTPNSELKAQDLPAEEPTEEITHHNEWVRACQGGPAASCDLAFGSRLSEICLVGNLATQTGEHVAWDSATFTAVPAAAQAWVSQTYRAGWEI